MNVNFCDVCNESIPLADLELGKAVRRNERLICAACEGAMSSARGRHDPVAVPPMVPVHRDAGSSSSPVAAVALAFSSVALVAGVGAGAYLFWRLEERSTSVQHQIADLERAAPEHARTVSAALVEESGVRESEAAELRAELQAALARVQELEQAGNKTAALERQVDKLQDRVETVDDLASQVQHQGGALDQLSATVAALSVGRAAKEAPAEKKTEIAQPVKPAPVDAPSVAEGAKWDKWIADLASPDPGTRWQAVQSLGGTHDADVAPHLVPMLADADIFVRMASCRHLGDLGSVSAIPALIDTLEDDEASVREAALVALRSLSGQAIPFDPLAREVDRSKRVKGWREWWEKASKDLLGREKGKSN